jgi:hypothetical protein
MYSSPAVNAPPGPQQLHHPGHTGQAPQPTTCMDPSAVKCLSVPDSTSPVVNTGPVKCPGERTHRAPPILCKCRQQIDGLAPIAPPPLQNADLSKMFIPMQLPSCASLKFRALHSQHPLTSPACSARWPTARVASSPPLVESHRPYFQAYDRLPATPNCSQEMCFWQLGPADCIQTITATAAAKTAAAPHPNT